MFSKIKNWWNEFSKSPEVKYLENATDHHDLELRMKRIQYQGYLK